MTRKEFEKTRLAIEAEKFREDCADPMTYGVRRAAFEKDKFKRLIVLARQLKMQTARTKLAQWKRQLERAHQTQARFEQLRQEMHTIRNGAMAGAQKSAQVEMA